MITKDTDADGVLDWEEGLWGTNPASKDTDEDGELDDVEIEKLKIESAKNNPTSSQEENIENLTETDKFSRELFATITALNQNGVIDQATVDSLSGSLTEQILNNTQKKIYTINDIKIIYDDSAQAVQKYKNSLITLYPRNPVENTVPEILQKFVNDENNGNTGSLSLLDPIIERSRTLVAGMLKVEVPQSFALIHLNLTNSFEKVLENLIDIKLFEDDPIIAFAGIAKYENNISAIISTISDMENMIKQKLNN